MSNKHNETNLKDALKAMLDFYKLKGKYQQSRLRQLWPELMGAAVAKYTTEMRIYKHTLFVTISSASLRQELSMGCDKIKDIMNEGLGEEYLKKVVIRG